MLSTAFKDSLIKCGFMRCFGDICTKKRKNECEQCVCIAVKIHKILYKLDKSERLFSLHRLNILLNTCNYARIVV